MEKFIRNIDSDLSLKCNAECLSTIDTVTRWVSFAEIVEDTEPWIWVNLNLKFSPVLCLKTPKFLIRILGILFKLQMSNFSEFWKSVVLNESMPPLGQQSWPFWSQWLLNKCTCCLTLRVYYKCTNCGIQSFF